jgi:hypothetical protein
LIVGEMKSVGPQLVDQALAANQRDDTTGRGKTAADVAADGARSENPDR